MKLLFKPTLLTFFFLFCNYSFSQDKKKDSLKIKKALLYFQKNHTTNAIFNLKDKKLPNFSLETLNDKSISSESLKGKPTIINFWFDACQPCIDELPLFNKLQEKYKDKVNFIAITFLNKEKINVFLKNHPFNFTHLIKAKKYIKKTGLFGYPKTLLLDKNLIVKDVDEKFSEEELTKEEKTELEKRLITLLNE